MIDISKIKVGDIVCVECKVKRVHESDINQPIFIEDLGWPHISRIISHTPAPRPFAVGDRVAFTGLNGSTYAGEIIVFHGDVAIVNVCIGSESRYMWPRKSILIHADKAP